MDLMGMVIVAGLVFFHSAQIFSGGEFHVENTQQGTAAGMAANLLLAFASMWGMPLMMFVNNLGYVGICVAGGIMAAGGPLLVGHIQAFIFYMRLFSHPIAQTANIANILQATMAAAERVFELLTEEEEIPDQAGE